MTEAQQVVGDQLAHAQVVDDDGVQRGAVALVVDDHGGDGLRHADRRLRVLRRRRENHAGDADARKRVHQAQLTLPVAVGFQHDGVVAVPVRLLGNGLRDERVVAARDQRQKDGDHRPVIRAGGGGAAIAERGGGFGHAPDSLLREGNARRSAQNHGGCGGRYAGSARDI